jgi:hypothetical protein
MIPAGGCLPDMPDMPGALSAVPGEEPHHESPAASSPPPARLEDGEDGEDGEDCPVAGVAAVPGHHCMLSASRWRGLTDSRGYV